MYFIELPLALPECTDYVFDALVPSPSAPPSNPHCRPEVFLQRKITIGYLPHSLYANLLRPPLQAHIPTLGQVMSPVVLSSNITGHVPWLLQRPTSRTFLRMAGSVSGRLQPVININKINNFKRNPPVVQKKLPPRPRATLGGLGGKTKVRLPIVILGDNAFLTFFFRKKIRKKKE
jgi:hypothetical protein